jgi:hypothetical protein
MEPTRARQDWGAWGCIALIAVGSSAAFGHVWLAPLLFVLGIPAIKVVRGNWPWQA